MNIILVKCKLCIKLMIILILVFLTAAPVFYLSAGTLSAALRGAVASDLSIRAELFINSVLINTGAAVISVILGLLSAAGIWTFFEKKAPKMAVAIILLFLLPSFIHVQSWIFFVDRINQFTSAFLTVAPNFSGVFAVIVTVSFSCLPITTGLCLFALLSVPSELADLCMLDLNGKAVFLKVYLPFLAPSLCIGGFLVFLLNINDYAIPSLFGVNVFALELFSRFSAGSDIYGIFVSSLPILLISAAVMLAFGLYGSKGVFSSNSLNCKNPFKNEKFLKIPAASGLVVLLFFVFVPLGNLIWEVSRARNAVNILSGSLNALFYSLGISSLTAVLCFIPALIFAYFFYKSKYRFILLSIACIPFMIPSPIAGLSLIEMWNTPILRIVYQSAFMPSIAMLSKFAFIEALILSIAVSRLENALLDNLRLYYPGFFGATWCMIRLIYKECLSCMLIVFALAMGEFGMTLLVTPPGYQTLAIKIYNYLHYGASETIAVLCLFMLFVVLAVAFAVYYLLTGEKDE